jgi:hypothetical protein
VPSTHERDRAPRRRRRGARRQARPRLQPGVGITPDVPVEAVGAGRRRAGA